MVAARRGIPACVRMQAGNPVTRIKPMIVLEEIFYRNLSLSTSLALWLRLL